MNDFDAILEFRKGERVHDTRPRVCSECNQRRDDVDLVAENQETGEMIYSCPECVAKEERATLEAQGVATIGIVKFNGQDTLNCLPYGWFARIAYGVLLNDGRIMWGDQEVKPTSYELI